MTIRAFPTYSLITRSKIPIRIFPQQLEVMTNFHRPERPKAPRLANIRRHYISYGLILILKIRFRETEMKTLVREIKDFVGKI